MNALLARLAAWAAGARRLLLAAGLALLAGAAGAAEPLRIVVPSSPGGPQDLLARLLAQHLSRLRGEPVIVLNKPGANAAIGIEFTLQAPAPDRILVMAASYLALGSVTGKLRFDPAVELKPVIKATEQDVVLVARPGLPVTSVADLVRSQEAGHKPSCGAGFGQMFIACLQLHEYAKGNLTPVPYNGMAKLANDVAGDRLDLAVVPAQNAAPHIVSGRMRALAVTGTDHNTLELFDKLPRIDALWPDIDVKLYLAFYAPAGASDAAVARWNADINTVLQMEEARRSLATAEMAPVGGPPEVLRQTFQRDLARFHRLLPLIEAASK